ncbi:uncharacterized protein LOC108961628 [Serinus canaria]|uniref:uncharacterized protein LOC108961628 n=1 Tax=Serinus canaria TaxID=9135 RepID=UPI0021CC9FF0|nr:uncharacterized protein LOC108961628 [Serinus canaria]
MQKPELRWLSTVTGSALPERFVPSASPAASRFVCELASRGRNPPGAGRERAGSSRSQPGHGRRGHAWDTQRRHRLPPARGDTRGTHSADTGCHLPAGTRVGHTARTQAAPARGDTQRGHRLPPARGDTRGTHSADTGCHLPAGTHSADTGCHLPAGTHSADTGCHLPAGTRVGHTAQTQAVTCPRGHTAQTQAATCPRGQARTAGSPKTAQRGCSSKFKGA